MAVSLEQQKVINGVEAQQFSSFVIGKVDAGVAVLISESVHLIEFPSLLLPPGVGPGSIVNISCTRDITAEKNAIKDFWELQSSILSEFGSEEPVAPRLRVKNTTQTSVTLEWDSLELAASNLLSLEIYRNGNRLTTIPNPLTNTSTKLSGLSLSTPYTFHLVLKTTAGTYTSQIVKIKTHSIEDTSGISITIGSISSPLLEETKRAVETMGGKWSGTIQIDTSHFITSESSSSPSVEQQKAEKLSLPILTPDWVLACAKEQKMLSISPYLIGVGSPVNRANSFSSTAINTSANGSAQNVGGREPVELMKNGASRRVSAAVNSPIEPVAVLESPRIPELAEEEPEQPEVEEEVVEVEAEPIPEPVVEEVIPHISAIGSKLEETVEEPTAEPSIPTIHVEEEPIESPPVPEIIINEPVISPPSTPKIISEDLEEMKPEEEKPITKPDALKDLNDDLMDAFDDDDDDKDEMIEVGL